MRWYRSPAFRHLSAENTMKIFRFEVPMNSEMLLDLTILTQARSPLRRACQPQPI